MSYGFTITSSRGAAQLDENGLYYRKLFLGAAVAQNYPESLNSGVAWLKIPGNFTEGNKIILINRYSQLLTEDRFGFNADHYIASTDSTYILAPVGQLFEYATADTSGWNNSGLHGFVVKSENGTTVFNSENKLLVLTSVISFTITYSMLSKSSQNLFGPPNPASDVFFDTEYTVNPYTGKTPYLFISGNRQLKLYNDQGNEAVFFNIDPETISSTTVRVWLRTILFGSATDPRFAQPHKPTSSNHSFAIGVAP